MSISNDIVSTKLFNKRDDFDFEIVNFSVLDGDVLEFIFLAMLLTSTIAMNCKLRNLLTMAIGVITSQTFLSKSYRRYYDLISKFHVRLKSLLGQGFSEPEFYGDLAFVRKPPCELNNFVF